MRNSSFIEIIFVTWQGFLCLVYNRVCVFYVCVFSFPSRTEKQHDTNLNIGYNIISLSFLGLYFLITLSWPLFHCYGPSHECERKRAVIKREWHNSDYIINVKTCQEKGRAPEGKGPLYTQVLPAVTNDFFFHAVVEGREIFLVNRCVYSHIALHQPVPFDRDVTGLEMKGEDSCILSQQQR